MKLQGYIGGTVSDAGKVVEFNGKKFVVFTVESAPEPGGFSKYPTRVKCTLYCKETDATAARLSKGAAVVVSGEVTAEGYTARNSDKPAASLKLFVKSYDVLSGTAPAYTPSEPQAQTPSRTTAPKPAAVPQPDQVDDIPF